MIWVFLKKGENRPQITAWKWAVPPSFPYVIKIDTVDTATIRRFGDTLFWDKSRYVISYPLVDKHSYWNLPFIVDLPIKNGDFP